MSIEELESQKELVLAQITKLGQTKEGLDAVVTGHEAQKSIYADLSKAIENKQSIIAILDPDIKSLTEKKLVLENQNNSLQVSISEKTALKEEVEKLKGMIKILQKEHEEFTVQHAEKKKLAETNLQGTVEKLQFLSATLSSLMNQIK